MDLASRQAWTFWYVRKGSLWERGDGSGPEPAGDEGPGIRLEHRGRHMESYRVAIVPGPDEDLDDVADRASDRADDEFLRHHPGVCLDGLVSYQVVPV